MLKEFLEKETTKRIIFFSVLVLLLYLARSVLNLLLLTFLFTYLISSLIDFIYKPISNVVKIKKAFISVTVYTLMVITIVLVVYKYIPIIVNQGSAILDQFTDLTIAPGNVSIEKYIMPYLNKLDIGSYTKSGFTTIFQFASSVGTWSVNIFIALLLSLFFILEKKTILVFLEKFKDSKISSFYEFVKTYGVNFLNTFGKVIRTQVVIATINSIVSVFFLALMNFPQLLALGFMIFILGLIPVAGVLISMVPLLLIAFKIGGFMKVLYVILMIAGIHALESYILNPRLMAEKTKLPVFVTFIVLIMGEHFMGVWGLLLGVPLFIFFMELLDINLHEKIIRKPKALESGESDQ